MNQKEFHSFVAATQENICQITALKNGVTLINDTWHDYKTTDTVHVMSATKSVVSLMIGIAPINTGRSHGQGFAPAMIGRLSSLTCSAAGSGLPGSSNIRRWASIF